jgi:hypothetical protein
MLDSDLTILGGQLNTSLHTIGAKTFSLIRQLDGATIRSDSSAVLSSPYLLTIRHTRTGKVGSLLDRHLVSFTKDLVGSAGAVQQAFTNLTIGVPASIGLQYTDDIQNMISNMIYFFGGSIPFAATPWWADLTSRTNEICRGES